VHKLNGAIANALHERTVAERLEGLGLTIVADRPEDFARFVAAESQKMRHLVQASGAKVE
jgi:tripartite-type tricarboxylate transporter receptor subunit TctC